MNLIDFLFKSTDEPAVLFENKWYSRKQIYQRILFTSDKLREKIQKGEKIGLIADNSIFFIISYFGIIESGGVCVPLYPGSGKEYITDIFSRAAVKNVFVQEKYASKAEGFNIFSEKDTDGSSVNRGETVGDNDCILILFTSGSTAKPKGVMLSTKNLVHNTKSIVEYLNMGKEDRILATLPFSYIFGLSWLHTSLYAGGQLVIENNLVPVGKILDALKRHECTAFSGVPTTFQLLLRTTEMKKMKFPTLRFVAQAGGKLHSVFIRELIEALPDSQIFIMYGQTEAAPRLSYLPPDRLKDKLGSIGKGIPGTVLEVLNENGQQVKPGELGEIVATGDNVMLGYFDSPEETQKVLKNGKLYTGDIATVDEDGFIYITDRAKNFIKTRGFRASAAEIENTILQIQDVVEVSVCGVPDEMAGEAIKALVVSRNPDITGKEIIDHCRNYLPPYKIPSIIEIVPEIKKTAYGKIAKVGGGNG